MDASHKDQIQVTGGDRKEVVTPHDWRHEGIDALDGLIGRVGKGWPPGRKGKMVLK